MSITVGTDTYISLADAETYLAAHYLSTDAKLVAWNALSSDGNKEILLRRAAKLIDSQPINGIRASDTQTMEFPRSRFSTYDMEYDEPTTIPDKVKYAQCEIAISMAKGISKRVELQRQGVKSFRIGNLQEAYGGNNNPYLSEEAQEYLSEFIGGSYRIL